MKKFHKTFGWVMVLKSNRNQIEVELESGESKTIHKDFLFDDETVTPKKTPKKTPAKDLRAIVHTMSAEEVKEH